MMIKIDCVDLGLEGSDYGMWRSYSLAADGSTVNELCETGYIEEIDSDGEVVRSYPLDDADDIVYDAALHLIKRSVSYEPTSELFLGKE